MSIPSELGHNPDGTGEFRTLDLSIPSPTLCPLRHTGWATSVNQVDNMFNDRDSRNAHVELSLFIFETCGAQQQSLQGHHSSSYIQSLV